jgi:hypothetical protein
VGKGLDMGERRLLNEMRFVVLSSLSFTGNNSVRYFNHVWLRKATGIVEDEKGNLTLERDLQQQVSFLVFGEGQESCRRICS